MGSENSGNSQKTKFGVHAFGFVTYKNDKIVDIVASFKTFSFSKLEDMPFTFMGCDCCDHKQSDPTINVNSESKVLPNTAE